MLFQKVKTGFEVARKKEAEFKEMKFMNKKIYFLDTSAIVHYSGRLYGCFLFNEFNSKYLIEGENNVFVTDEHALKEIFSMEICGENGIYFGFTNFIKSNFEIILEEDFMKSIREENYINSELNKKLVISEKNSSAHIIGSLYFLYNKGFDPILVTCDTRLATAAQKRGFEIYKIK